MANTKPGRAGEQPAQRRRGCGKEGAEAFDIWLQRGLHQLYDSVAKEPIPDELLDLIEQDQADRSK